MSLPLPEDIFYKTLIHGSAASLRAESKDDPDLWPLMTRAHFSEAMVSLALQSEINDDDLPVSACGDDCAVVCALLTRFIVFMWLVTHSVVVACGGR